MTGTRHSDTEVFRPDPGSEGDGPAESLLVERSAHDPKGTFLNMGGVDFWLSARDTRSLAALLDRIVHDY